MRVPSTTSSGRAAGAKWWEWVVRPRMQTGRVKLGRFAARPWLKGRWNGADTSGEMRHPTTVRVFG